MADHAVGDGFDEWFVERYPQARSVARRIVGSASAAEDAAAEAFTRALVKWPKVRDLPYRDAWVLRVTANVAVDHVRRHRPDPVPDVVSSDVDDVAVLRLSLVDALGRLPRRQREAVVLRHLAGLSLDEVSAAMGVSGNSAKKHLQRGIDRLRRLSPEQLGADRAFT
jgi:RNA polymerase sigma factor (sigma-70 family)